MTEKALITMPDISGLPIKTQNKLIKIWQKERDKERIIGLVRSAGSSGLEVLKTVAQDETGQALIVWSTCYGMAYVLKKVNKNSVASITVLSIGNAMLISRGIENIIDILNPWD